MSSPTSATSTTAAPPSGAERISTPAAAQAWRRTMFIVLDSGLAIRNILRTDVFKVLKAQADLRIVIFSPLTDADFKKEFEAPNVVVEPIPQRAAGHTLALLRSLKKEIWAKRAGLYTFEQKRSRKRGRKLRSILTLTLLRANTPARMDKWLERLNRWEASLTAELAPEYFDQYRPDLVFYTTIYSKSHNLERGAQQRGVKGAAFILSWDNPTSKGPLPVRPDHIILWNEILRQEILTFHGCRPEQLYVSGVPQFDIYAQHDQYADRAEFFRKWGLDPSRKLITYTTGTPGTAPFDHEVVDQLYTAMQKGALRQPCQLLVRLHPKDTYEDYRRFENKPNLVLQLPGRRAENTSDSWNPTREDMYGLAELMYYTDVNVNVASTITIDASAFDKPVVNVAYDGYTNKPYPQSCLRYYDYEHYKRIVATGGVRIAKTPDEMMQHIQSYLDDPTLEAAGRQRIREEQCWKLDGKSGRRIGEYLLGVMGYKV